MIWLKDGLSLPAKATTATREGLTQLIVPGAEFSDGGHYDIILQTEQGKKETFSFLVQVIGNKHIRLVRDADLPIVQELIQTVEHVEVTHEHM